jgi:hypothetical protein
MLQAAGVNPVSDAQRDVRRYGSHLLVAADSSLANVQRNQLSGKGDRVAQCPVRIKRMQLAPQSNQPNWREPLAK